MEEHPLEVTGDILLIAGDTAYLDTPKSGQDSYTRYSFWDWAAEHYRQVIVCFGNHDFYVIQGRHDVCALPRAVVLVEALAAMVTVDEMMLANML